MLMVSLLGVIIKVGCILLQLRSKAQRLHPKYSKTSYRIVAKTRHDIERLKLANILNFIPNCPKYIYLLPDRTLILSAKFSISGSASVVVHTTLVNAPVILACRGSIGHSFIPSTVIRVDVATTRCMPSRTMYRSRMIAACWWILHLSLLPFILVYRILAADMTTAEDLLEMDLNSMNGRYGGLGGCLY